MLSRQESRVEAWRFRVPIARVSSGEPIKTPLCKVVFPDYRCYALMGHLIDPAGNNLQLKKKRKEKKSRLE